MIRINLDLNKSELAGFEREVNKLDTSFSKGLRKAMLFVEGETKKGFGRAGQVKVRTGRLRRSIASGANGLEGWVGTNVVYGPTHEFGAVIRPKTGQYLKFQIQGRWKTVKQVIIPKRPFLLPAMKNNSKKVVEIITKEVLEAFHK